MIINPFCAPLGWLFDDIKGQFESWNEGRVFGARVLTTPVPTHADAWICIRSWEAGAIPDPRRAVIQIHALDPHLILGNSPTRNLEAIDDCPALVFTHPEQPAVLRELGLTLEGKKCLLRPIGALEFFTMRDRQSVTPTFGWFGRDTGANKRTALFTAAFERLAAQTDVAALLVGEGLTSHFESLASQSLNVTLTERRHTAIADYPPLYKLCDAIVITSELEAGPMCLYEALASGVPVITTRCGWAEYLIQDGVNGYIVDEGKHLADDIAHRMLDIASHRTEWFERRHLIAASLMGWSMDSWIEGNVQLAMEVAR